MLAAPRDLASAQAAAMIAQLDQIRPGASTALAVDTLAVLSTWDDIDVRVVPEAITPAGGSGTDCSVAGLYIDDQAPPILAVGCRIGRRQRTPLC